LNRQDAKHAKMGNAFIFEKNRDFVRFGTFGGLPD